MNKLSDRSARFFIRLNPGAPVKYSKLLCTSSRLNGPTSAQSTNKSNSSQSDRGLLRNIGIVAHINAGKTTTTERILYHSGSTIAVGDVDRGNTVTDYLVQERDRGITITSAAVSYNWKKHRVNLIDTPGHVDFTIEVERSLAVLDGAVTLLDASAGVEAQTITVWNQALRYKLPNVIFLNKCDKPQADYTMCMKDLKTSLDIKAALVQLPVPGKIGKLESIIDVINRKHLVWVNPEQDNGSDYKSFSLQEAKNLDKRYLELAEEKREILVNYLSDLDDNLASHVLECDKIGQVSSYEITNSLRRATLACKLSPVLVGSSFKYLGVQQLMDSIIEYLPSPIEREAQIAREFGLENDPKSKGGYAFIFKIMHDKRLGPLTYFRVCNGSISKLQRLNSMETGASEQIKKLYRVFADELREIDEPVLKDDIVVATGISESRTGDIMTNRPVDIQKYDRDDDNVQLQTPTSGEKDPSAIKNLPFKLLDGRIVVPQISEVEPVYFCSIESLKASEQLKLERALNNLSREDPSFSFEIDGVGMTTIRGMGKLHLEIVRDRINTEYGIEALLGPMQISYRETIEGSATEELEVNRLINGVKNRLTIKLQITSKPKAGPWSHKMLRLDTQGENSLSMMRRGHRKAIENGITSALAHGPLAGYPMIDCDILLLDFLANGRCGLPVISASASQCVQNAVARCSPTLLEPVMLLEVVAPKEYNGTILADITSTRRGQVISTSERSNGTIVLRATAPLSLLANYSEHLRITTSGRGSFSMELQDYVAMSEQDKLGVLRI